MSINKCLRDILGQSCREKHGSRPFQRAAAASFLYSKKDTGVLFLYSFQDSKTVRKFEGMNISIFPDFLRQLLQRLFHYKIEPFRRNGYQRDIHRTDVDQRLSVPFYICSERSSGFQKALAAHGRQEDLIIFKPYHRIIHFQADSGRSLQHLFDLGPALFQILRSGSGGFLLRQPDRKRFSGRKRFELVEFVHKMLKCNAHIHSLSIVLILPPV